MERTAGPEWMPFLSLQVDNGIVQFTADKVGPSAYNAADCSRSSGWSQQLGFGRVTLARALTAAAPWLRRP